MTVTPAAPEPAAGFTPEQLELQERARRFVDEILIPNEELAELNGGHIPDELKQRIKDEAIAAGLSGGLHSPEHGGQGWTKTEWFLVEEQLGRSTNALSWHIPAPTTCWRTGRPSRSTATCARRCAASSTTPTPSPRRRRAPTPRGSRPRPRSDAGWVIDGEKWFVTYGDIAAVYIVMAKALVDGQELATLFLVDRAARGIEIVDDPPFTHTYPHGHPDDPLQRSRGARRRRGGRARRGRGPAARLVHGGAARASPRAASGRCGA